MAAGVGRHFEGLSASPWKPPKRRAGPRPPKKDTAIGLTPVFEGNQSQFTKMELETVDYPSLGKSEGARPKEKQPNQPKYSSSTEKEEECGALQQQHTVDGDEVIEPVAMGGGERYDHGRDGAYGDM